MGQISIARKFPLGLSLLAALVLALPAASLGAAKTVEPKPRPTTGAALHVLATSAQLTGLVNPDGTEASFYFQYGPTAAYGSQTPTQVVPGAGTAKLKVGAPVSNLIPGATYHYRLVAIDTRGAVVPGRDRAFVVKILPLKFEFVPGPQAVFGLPFLLSGTLHGFGSARRQVILQATAFPFLAPFVPIGPAALTDVNGRFSFRVANLAGSTDFRVVTTDLRPIYSPILNIKAAARVTLHARSSVSGLVRLYGTVSPAEVGAKLLIQLHRGVTRPGSSETTEKFVSAFTTTVKKGGRTFSRFSVVVKVLRTGRYRAQVRVRKGAPVVSGASATIVLHAKPGATQRKS